MGSVCSKAHGHLNLTKMMENSNVQDESDPLVSANENQSSTTSHEHDLSPARVVPSYSWLVSSPVDFEATAEKLNAGKTKQPSKISSMKYCNGGFLKYLCQPSTTEVPPLNKKRSPNDRAGDQSSSSSGSSNGQPRRRNIHNCR